MKKVIASVLSILAVSAACGVSAAAANEELVYVTIADANGELALAAQPMWCSDADGDGALTVNDALYLAHEQFYEGGAAAGYGTSRTEFGLGITKLWGAEQGSSYGYCVNNKSAMSLEDPVSHAAFVSAYVYTDLSGFSDTYCYFDINDISTSVGDTYTFTLTANSYDENWNPITVPVEGATIVIDGEKTNWKTDAQGSVTVTFEKGGEYVISAVSDTQILVPPVCRADVAAPATEAPATTTTEAATTTQAATTTTVTTTATTAASATTTSKGGASNVPSTGDSTGIFALGAAALTALGALMITRRRDEK